MSLGGTTEINEVNKPKERKPTCWCLVVWNVCFMNGFSRKNMHDEGTGFSNFLGRKVFLEPKVGPHEREAGSIIDHCRFL